MQGARWISPQNAHYRYAKPQLLIYLPKYPVCAHIWQPLKILLPIILPKFTQFIHIYTWIYTYIHLLYTLDFREYLIFTYS